VKGLKVTRKAPSTLPQSLLRAFMNSLA